MDFLVMLSIYLLACACMITCILQADHPFLSQGPVAHIRAAIFKGCMWIIDYLVPHWLQHLIIGVYEQFFCKRNCFFQVLYTAMVVVGHGVWVLEGLQYLYVVEPDVNHVFWPMVLLVANSCLFLVCCISDPGVIQRDNLHNYLTAYQYDGVLYEKNRECPTCHLLKPARSKHCAVSNKCVFKFDHFCAWTNNCVGGLNQRYFLAFLVSACVMCANGAAAVLRAIINITHIYNLWSRQYIDDSGQPQLVNFKVLAQSLFMQFPRLVFLAAALSVITVVMTGFTCYHLYLVATNQTTNERYKKHYLRRDGATVPSTNPYDRGLWRNAQEMLFPWQRVNLTGQESNGNHGNWKHKKRR